VAYTIAAENAAVTGIKTNATFISLHTADPGTTGASEVVGGTYARVATTWPANPTNGSITGSAATINVPAATTITHWGLWTTGTAGTVYYGGTLPASETFGTAGTYSLTPSLSATN
jgi:hypothetical protein